MKKIYISGKITGLPIEEARYNFAVAEKRLRSIGYEPINPMMEVPYNPNWTWNDYMIKDIKILLNCDGIYMLYNWKDSKGARIEHNIAVETDKIIIYEGVE
jgi:hypothetical protein